MKKLKLRINKGIVSVCEPDGFTICMADGNDILKWKAEYDALIAVAVSARKARDVLTRARCGDCGLQHIQSATDCEIELAQKLDVLNMRMAK